MKVLQVVGSLGRGGAETMITNYNKVAVKHNCQFDYIIHDNKDFGYEDDVKNIGSNLFLIDKPGKVGMFNYIKILVEAIKKNGPYDAIHAHTDYQVFMVVIAAKIAKISNCVVHSHTTNYSKIQKIVNRIIFFIFKPIKLACGEEAGNALYGKGHYLVLNNAIPVTKYIGNDENKQKKLKDELGLSFDSRIIGQVGRLNKVKNHEFSFTILKELLDQNKNYILVVVGDGEEKDNLIKKCKDLNIESSVKFLGLRNDMYDIYHLFDVLIMPSLYEGLPMTLLEAQAASIPCLCSNNISKESDRKLELVKFLPLEIREWAKEITNVNKIDIEPSKIKKTMQDYDIDTQCIKLLKIYMTNGEINENSNK